MCRRKTDGNKTSDIPQKYLLHFLSHTSIGLAQPNCLLQLQVEICESSLNMRHRWKIRELTGKHFLEVCKTLHTPQYEMGGKKA